MQATANETMHSKRLRQSSVSSSGSSPTKGKSKGQRKSTSLPAETVEYLKAWMMSPEHIAHPYPTEQEKAQIMTDTGIELKQLTNWFVNNRKRYWKPRVEARLQQQAHAAAAVAQVQAAAAAVAAVSAVTHANPVTPEPGFRPTLTVQPSNNFVSFDLCAVPQTSRTVAKPRTVSMISPDFSKFLPSATGQQSGSVHAISEASSSSSVATSDSSDGGMDSSTEDIDNVATGNDDVVLGSGIVSRTEKLDVHILRPLSGQEPTLEDVTVLANVPSERILRTYEDCCMSYHFPGYDNKKMQSRRDAEIVRLKKHHLKMYMDEVRPSLPAKKRKQPEGMSVPSTPRKQYRRVSVELWRDACLSAPDAHDNSLPTMEEASRLFGYTN